LSGTITPKVQRFQTLIALMLSSQTKDIITGATIKKLQKELPGGLCLDAILKVNPSLLNEFIKSVGFHNRKTEYIKQTAIVLRDKFNGDIPETIEGMCSLPGVGPKMAHLLSSSAWNKYELLVACFRCIVLTKSYQDYGCWRRHACGKLCF